MSFNLLLFTLFCLATSFASVASREPVDLILVLATDVSDSITPQEHELQKYGLAEALVDPETEHAIRRCAPRGAALAYTEWSGSNRTRAGQYKVAVPFRKVTGGPSLRALAADIKGTSRAFRDETDVHLALKSSHLLIHEAPFEAQRRVIDVSSDGTQNVNVTSLPTAFTTEAMYVRALERIRDKIVADGVTINALVIEARGAGSSLEPYFAAHVIGGPGAFTVIVRDFADVRTAFVRKLTREICGHYVATRPDARHLAFGLNATRGSVPPHE